jgi:hypothetical protein
LFGGWRDEIAFEGFAKRHGNGSGDLKQ